MPWIAFAGASFALLAATATAGFLSRGPGPRAQAGRYDTIDGLRGYLALFVFLHHSSIWYFYAHGDRWQAPPSNLFTLFGEGGVAMFFMITGFLFFGKLLDRAHGRVDWIRLYVSRFLRLVPLYAFAMLLLFLVVAVETGWRLHEPLSRVLGEAAAWLGFTIRGNPDLNGFADTVRIIAGVTWSLPYEWFFYFSLPLIGIALSIRPSIPFLLLALGASILVAAGFWRPGFIHAGAFLGGIIAAVLVRSREFRAFAGAPWASALVLLSTAALVALFPGATSTGATVLLAVVFAIVAGGCTVFGALATPASRLLGDIAYSVYMLHGIALFVLFRWAHLQAAALSPAAHWLAIVLLAPVLVAGCYATYRLIEKPAMDRVPSLTKRVRHLVSIHAHPAEDEERALPLS